MYVGQLVVQSGSETVQDIQYKREPRTKARIKRKRRERTSTRRLLKLSELKFMSLDLLQAGAPLTPSAVRYVGVGACGVDTQLSVSPSTNAFFS